MRALKILTALTIAAGSSVAAAQPVPVDREDGIYDRRGSDYDRDDRYDRDAVRGDRYSRWDMSRYARDHRGRWVPMIVGTRAESGRQLIPVDRRSGPIDKLRVEANRGAPVIKRVAVEYTNGQREVVRVNQQLRRGEGQIIDLQGDRRVSRIVVITDPRYRGQYSVYGT